MAERDDFLHALVAYFDVAFTKCHKTVRFTTGECPLGWVGEGDVGGMEEGARRQGKNADAVSVMGICRPPWLPGMHACVPFKAP